MEKKIQVDVVILSYARDEQLKKLTNSTIQSLLASEDSRIIQFNIVVVESNRLLAPYQFEHSNTIYPEGRFGFHKYLNIGIKVGNNPYTCLCNNDLIFHKGWASSILSEMADDPELMSVSPYCPISHKTNGIADDGKIHYSTQPGILIGWCIFLKREILNTIGYLDEKIEFWYSDNDYGNTLKKYHIKHALLTSSKVTHIGSQSMRTLNQKEVFDFSYGQYTYFDFKWNHHNKLLFMAKKLLLPLFYLSFSNRNKGGVFNLAARVLSKLYGGLKA